MVSNFISVVVLGFIAKLHYIPQTFMEVGMSIGESFTKVEPDFFRDFQTIVVLNGFLFDKYTVTTQDGYILTLFRIR